MNKATLVLILIIVFSFALSAYFYPKLPSQIATHWNLSGEADGYSSKAFGLFLIPVLLVVLFTIFMFIPRIDPLRENVKKFWNEFVLFIAILFFFMLYLQLLLIQWNRGVEFDFVRFLTPAFSVLFFYIGVLLEKSKRNWFIGIRTPWTLSNDQVWEKTHQLAAPLFKVAAILNLAGIIWPALAFFLLFGSILTAALVPSVYSYFVFRDENK